MNKALVYEKVFAESRSCVSITLTRCRKKNVLASLVHVHRLRGMLSKWLWRAGRENRSHQLYSETWEISNSNRCLFFFQKKNLTFCAPKSKSVYETSGTARYNTRRTLSLCRLNVLFRVYINLLRYEINKVRKKNLTKWIRLCQWSLFVGW